MTYAVETCHLSKSIDGNAILNDITMGVKQGGDLRIFRR